MAIVRQGSQEDKENLNKGVKMKALGKQVCVCVLRMFYFVLRWSRARGAEAAFKPTMSIQQSG